MGWIETTICRALVMAARQSLLGMNEQRQLHNHVRCYTLGKRSAVARYLPLESVQRYR